MGSINRPGGGNTIAAQEKIIDVINDYVRHRDRDMFGVAGTDWLAGYYYNQLQTTSPNPSEDTCTRGYYWPTGTINPQACGIGTYNKKLGSTASTDWVACPLKNYEMSQFLLNHKNTFSATKYWSNGNTQTN